MVVAFGLGTGDHPEEEVAILGSRDGDEGGDHQIDGGGLLWLPCDGRFRVIEGEEYREENFLMRFVKVGVGGEVRHSKEQSVPRNLGGVACR